MDYTADINEDLHTTQHTPHDTAHVTSGNAELAAISNTSSYVPEAYRFSSLLFLSLPLLSWSFVATCLALSLPEEPSSARHNTTTTQQQHKISQDITVQPT
jgi:hypothetical protein